MKEEYPVGSNERDAMYRRLHDEAEAAGYHLNPDREFVDGLVEGLITNSKRYGYGSCPCRLASGSREGDLDIVCPCDYRDADIRECGACFCGLYVSEEVLKGAKTPCSIPERRPQPDARKKSRGPGTLTAGPLPYPVWRCRVCGYLCAMDEPPEACPICKAGKERFERFT